MAIWHGDSQARMTAECRMQAALTAFFDAIEDFARNDDERNEPIYNGAGSFGMAQLDTLCCAALESHAAKHGKIRANLMMRLLASLDLPKSHELAEVYYNEGHAEDD